MKFRLRNPSPLRGRFGKHKRVYGQGKLYRGDDFFYRFKPTTLQRTPLE